MRFVDPLYPSLWWLRLTGLLLQLLLMGDLGPALGLKLELLPLWSLMALEAGLLALGLRQTRWIPLHTQLLLDTLLWSGWIYFSGGASNAFVSLLLLPVTIAAVTLTPRQALLNALLACLGYTLMLMMGGESQMLGSGGHHHAAHDVGTAATLASTMSGHFIGMWLNFIISCLALLTVVTAMSRKLRAREQSLVRLKETQLRHEQLLALGTSSAQLSHQLATPLASLQLLHEELAEQYPSDPTIAEMAAPLRLCQLSLEGLRRTARSLAHNTQVPPPQGSFHALLRELAEQLQLLRPGITPTLSLPEQDCLCNHDVALKAALLAIADNGAIASLNNRASTLEIRARQEAARLVVELEDRGQGHKPVHSPGLGIGLMLSQASLERFGAELSLTTADHGGMLARIALPRFAEESP